LLVSVVMPVYNAASTLGPSIRSVLAQTHAEWELIIADDGSTDGSVDLALEYAAGDERIRLLDGGSRAGAARARNRASSAANGDFIAFLDSDDMWLPAKLERQLAFAGQTDAALTFTSYYKVAADHAGEAAAFTPNGRVVRAPDRVDYRAMLQYNHIGCLTAMYDRRVLGTRLMPDLRKRQDYALWLSILREHGTHARGLPEPLALYREARPGSLSGNKLSLVRYNWQLYREVEGLSLPR
jgi:teichuronic acid biosynthesis glycosyltransferase TuaG